MLFGDTYSQLYFTSSRNEAQGDGLSGITGTKLAISSCQRKTIRASGAAPRP